MDRLQLLKKGIALADRNIRLFLVYFAASAAYSLVLAFAVRTFHGDEPVMPETMRSLLTIEFGMAVVCIPLMAALDCFIVGTLRRQLVDSEEEHPFRRFYGRAVVFELLLVSLLLVFLWPPFVLLLPMVHIYSLLIIAYLFWHDCGVVRAVKEGSRAVSARLNAFLPVMLMGFFLYILLLVAREVALKQVPELVRTLFVDAVLSYVDIAILCISFVLFIELPQKGPASSDRNTES